MLLAALAVSSINFGQMNIEESTSICYSVDEFEDTKDYSSPYGIFYEDGGDMRSEGMSGTIFIRDGKKGNLIKPGTFYLKVLGLKSSCVDTGSTLDIIFEDGSKTQLVSWKKFNCDGENYFSIDSKLNILKQSPIKAIRYTNKRSYETMVIKENIDETNSRFFMNLLSEVDKINSNELVISECKD